jgi:hypothetical protein
MLAEYFLENEKLKEQWKHIILVVGRRKRGENGLLGNFVTAINVTNDRRANLFIESHVLDEQNIPEIEVILRKAGLQLAESNVSIYI